MNKRAALYKYANKYTELIKRAYTFDPNMIPENSVLAKILNDNLTAWHDVYYKSYAPDVAERLFEAKKNEIISNAVPVAGQARRDYAREIGSAYEDTLKSLRDKDSKFFYKKVNLTPEQLASAILSHGRSMGKTIQERNRQFVDVENGRQLLLQTIVNKLLIR